MNPLRKPRHADGRPMSDDEIRALDGLSLREKVGVFLMGWTFSDGDGSRGSTMMIGSPAVGWAFRKWDDEGIPQWESDIAAAFTVDRPDWSWNYFDFFDGQI